VPEPCSHEWVLVEARLSAGGADQVWVCRECGAVTYAAAEAVDGGRAGTYESRQPEV
jgi:hypothetical protein